MRVRHVSSLHGHPPLLKYPRDFSPAQKFYLLPQNKVPPSRIVAESDLKPHEKGIALNSSRVFKQAGVLLACSEAWASFASTVCLMFTLFAI